MGYILPINSYRSQQYANRLLNRNDNYSKISQLQQVQKIDQFKENHEEVVNRERAKEQVREEHDSLAVSDFNHEVIGYVNPNPAELSIKNASIVKKVDMINAYS